VREVEAADAGRRRHRQALGQAHADLAGLQHLEHVALDAVVGAGRIARRRADAAVLLGDQVLVAELLVGRVAPELGAHALVQPLGEGLGQPVGQGLEHDRRVVVVVVGELLLLLLHAQARSHGEQADVVGRHALGRDEVGQAAVRSRHAVDHRALGLQRSGSSAAPPRCGSSA
jgi:hypothetical protein